MLIAHFPLATSQEEPGSQVLTIKPARPVLVHTELTSLPPSFSLPLGENRSKHDLDCKLRVEQLSTGGVKSLDQGEGESSLHSNNNMEQEEVFIDSSGL